jgi:hypothetical protein
MLFQLIQGQRVCRDKVLHEPCDLRQIEHVDRSADGFSVPPGTRGSRFFLLDTFDIGGDPVGALTIS